MWVCLVIVWPRIVIVLGDTGVYLACLHYWEQRSREVRMGSHSFGHSRKQIMNVLLSREQMEHVMFNVYFLVFVEPWKCSFGDYHLIWTNSINSSLAEGQQTELDMND